LHQEKRQKRPLTFAGETNGPTVHPDLERTENTELEPRQTRHGDSIIRAWRVPVNDRGRTAPST
jgi:hypothetical protein